MWRLIARKDFRDSIRERQLHLGLGLFVFVGLITGYMYGEFVGRDGSTADPGIAFLGILIGATLFLAPITGLMLSQGRIVDKRSRGELVVLLGMPFSRRDVVVGSLASRIAVSGVVIASLFAVATGVAAIMLVPIPLLRIILTLVGFVAFTAIFVSVGIGVSAAVSGTTRAAIIAVGFYLFFIFRIHNHLWSLFLFFVYDGSAPAGLNAVVKQLGPFSALRNLVAGIYPEVIGAFGYFGGDAPTELTIAAQPAVGVLVLAFWGTVPLYVGLQRFEDTDL